MKKQFWAFPGPFTWPGLGFGRHARFFEAGEVRLAILSLLSDGPKHGYQLMKELKERSGGAYSASAGSVYPTLQQLEDEGLVEAALESGRRVYHLTDAGRAELDKDPDSVRQIWERAEHFGDGGQLNPLAAVIRASLQAAGRGESRRVREILDRTLRDLEKL